MDFIPASAMLKLLPPLELLSLNSNIHFHWFFCCYPFLTSVLPTPINIVTISSPVPYYLLIFLNYNVFPTHFSASTSSPILYLVLLNCFPHFHCSPWPTDWKQFFWLSDKAYSLVENLKKCTICPQSTFLAYLLPSPYVKPLQWFCTHKTRVEWVRQDTYQLPGVCPCKANSLGPAEME